jgi:integrase
VAVSPRSERQLRHAERQEITTKSGKARRVPLTPELRDTLAAVLLDRRDDTGTVRPDAPVFGARYVENAYGRSRKTWTDSGLNPIDLHTARHTFASLMIAAGINAKALSDSWGTARSRSRSTCTATSCPAQRRRPRPWVA